MLYNNKFLDKKYIIILLIHDKKKYKIILLIIKVQYYRYN